MARARRCTLLGVAMLGLMGCGSGPLTAGSETSETSETSDTETGAGPCTTELPGLDVASVIVADLDGDGHLDLAGVGSNGDSSSGPLELAWGHGDGSFTPEIVPSFSPTRPALARLLAGDVDADGDLDLVLYHHTSDIDPDGGLNRFQSVTVRRQTGPRSFGPAQVSELGQDWTPWEDLAALLRDVDADGDADLVVADVLWPVNPGPDSVNNGVASSDGAGGFGPLIPSGLLVWCYTIDIEAGDFDGDGRDEYIWVGPWNCNGGNDPTPAYVVALDLAGQASIVTELSVGYFPSQAVVADFDGDGALDLIIRNSSDLSRFRGLGDGSFETLDRVALTTPSGVAISPHRLEAVELDGDGGTELLVAANHGDLGWMTWRIDQPFAAATLTLATEHRVEAVGDFDEDGCDDLLVRDYLGPAHPQFRWSLLRCAGGCGD